MARVEFDRFELGQVIGTGTVGTIYRVVDRQTDRIAALKLLAPGVGRDKLVAARFAREMMILEKLRHPHIIEYFGGGEHEGQLFYVMELIEGGTLKELMRTDQFSWGEAAECGRQIAAALQHAHNFGIIHRDLKPGNVFLTLDGTCKLGDFGIARDLNEVDLTDAGLTVGTYAYMAPELVKGERNITGQVDLYALGCLLFEMVAGRLPFPGDNFAQIFEQHLHAEIPSIGDFVGACPAELDRLIQQLLAKNPDDRPFNARAVQGILGELTDAGPMASGRDRAAAKVTYRRALRDRIVHRADSREVSWGRLAAVAVGVVLVVLIAVWSQL